MKSGVLLIVVVMVAVMLSVDGRFIKLEPFILEIERTKDGSTVGQFGIDYLTQINPKLLPKVMRLMMTNDETMRFFTSLM